MKIGDKIIFDGYSAAPQKDGKITFKEDEMLESIAFISKYEGKEGTITKLYKNGCGDECTLEFEDGTVMPLVWLLHGHLKEQDK